MPRLVETAIDVMGNAYPDVVKNRDFLVGVLTREEERFRHTLKTGLGILDDELAAGESLPLSYRFIIQPADAPEGPDGESSSQQKSSRRQCQDYYDAFTSELSSR